jgi:flavin reductase (DIM6/NTAB) family NADH-FMN oxidoreductase RutF
MSAPSEPPTVPEKTIDGKSFWGTLGQRAIGASIVTAQGADGPAGFLALSAAHVTANPPTMLVSIDDRTAALAALIHGRHFAINYLPADAQDIAEMFGGKGSVKGVDRFEAGRWHSLASGAPVFKDAVGVIDCVLEDTFRYAATTIAIGRVVDLAAKGDSEALVYFRGQYLKL